MENVAYHVLLLDPSIFIGRMNTEKPSMKSATTPSPRTSFSKLLFLRTLCSTVNTINSEVNTILHHSPSIPCLQCQIAGFTGHKFVGRGHAKEFGIMGGSAGDVSEDPMT